VATTVAPTGWVLDRLLAEDTRVVVLVGPGDNPHTWTATDTLARDVAAARVYVRVGIPIEGSPWFRAVQAHHDLALVDLEQPPEPHDHSVPHADPHPWTDPLTLRRHLDTLVPALTAAFPDAAERITDRAEVLDHELDALDRELEGILAPCRGRAFLVFHPAWSALAERYGLEQISVEAEGKDPLDAELVALGETIRARDIRTLLLQPQIKRNTALAVAESFGLPTAEVDPLARDLPAALRRFAATVAEDCR
jgi:zinc transport system substrate-binding protein